MHRITIRATAAKLALVAATLVAGCDKDCAPVHTSAGAEHVSDVRSAAENSLRVSASNSNSVRFRGVQVWPQAIKNQFAVCGQANVFGPASNTYVLFVATVTQDEFNQDPARKFKVEVRVGSTEAEATKVYVDALARCFEGGGPQNQRRNSVAPLPPLPEKVEVILSGPSPTPVTPVPGPVVPGAAAVQPVASPASGMVVMRQAGNIRASPQGGTLRVEPAGRELRVFGEAAGGWLQIGIGSQPDGWVHGSLVQRR